VVDGTTYDVTFIGGVSYSTAFSSMTPTFLNNESGATDAGTAIALFIEQFPGATFPETVQQIVIPYFANFVPVFPNYNFMGFTDEGSFWFGGTNFGYIADTLEASQEFAIFSATPLPAALPLFATGLGGLGLLGWRRKRKNAAAIAAA
jgi:hypothetical protein